MAYTHGITVLVVASNRRFAWLLNRSVAQGVLKTIPCSFELWPMRLLKPEATKLDERLFSFLQTLTLP